MTAEGAFRLGIRIAADLSATHVDELRGSLARSHSEVTLRRKDARSGTFWIIDLGRADRPEVLIQRLTDHGEELAHAIARAVTGQDDAVLVSLCQEIDDVDDSAQKGIWFSAEAVRWTALAGASIDIDQYIYVD